MSRFSIIDSHIHLYASSHVPRLNWTADLAPDHPLNRQHSVTDYRNATGSPSNLRGFIFLETDRKSGLGEGEWQDALEEVGFLLRITGGTPIKGEGHSVEDKVLVLAIIPWAPVPAGPAALAKYMEAIKARFDTSPETWNKIRGVRYLVQDKAPGTILRQDFIKGLNWLGSNQLTFDLGVDARSGGLHQLREACEMLERTLDSGVVPTIIINHLCKPNLRLSVPEVLGGHPEFVEWTVYVQKMASFNSTYMKLSGMFSELPPQEDDNPTKIQELVMHTKPWVDIIFAAFGPSRIMFGSDWPVCNVGGPGIKQSWSHWMSFVTAILEDQGITEQEKARVWAGTAAEAYGISLR